MSAPIAGTEAIVKLAVALSAAPPPLAFADATVTATSGTRPDSFDRVAHVALSSV